MVKVALLADVRVNASDRLTRFQLPGPRAGLEHVAGLDLGGTDCSP
jgi:hypothetical protein